MRVLFVVLDAGTAGHTRTAVDVARGIRDAGGQVIFLVGSGSNPGVVKESGFTVHAVRRDLLGTYFRLGRRISELREETGISAVHLFGTVGVGETVLGCYREALPLVVTVSSRPKVSGWVPPPYAVFVADEFRRLAYLAHRYPMDRGEVLAARVDIRRVEGAVAFDGSEGRGVLRATVGADPSHYLILRICRVHPLYRTSIIEGALIAEELSARGIPSKFVHVGFIEDDEVFEDCQRVFMHVNSRLASEVAVSVQQDHQFPLKWLAAADFAIGSGRTTFEAMVAHVPCVVVGEYGFAGIAGGDETGPLAAFNFSGRNVHAPRLQQESVRNAVDRIRELIDSPLKRGAVVDAARRLVEDEYSTQSAATRYLQLYGEVPLVGKADVARVRLELALVLLKASLRWFVPRRIWRKLGQWSLEQSRIG